MAEFFDAVRWQQIVTQPDWYMQLYPELKSLREQWEAEPDQARAEALKTEVRSFFEQGLLGNTVALAESGPDLDAERQPIDTIVIHHTGAEPGYRLSYMNAVQMLNVYVPYFINPTNEAEQELKGQPLWSSHVRGGRPVFYLYHWLMRMDGSFESLLEDRELGWHAANWDVNRRSIGVCLDNDYEQSDPDPTLLRRLGQFIAEHYPQVSRERIFGHTEVSRQPTICPGGNFQSRWKQQLISAMP
jgi:hypothetical protein